MSQRQQLERIFKIDRKIRAGEFPSADRLARDLEVCRRVVFNDRQFMIDRLGAPIEYDRFHHGWYYTELTWVLPNIMVTEGELLAFFLSVEVARRYLGTALEPSLRSAVEKIGKTIKGPVVVDLDNLMSHYTFAAPALASANEETLLALNRAIKNNSRVRMRYYTASRDEHKERTVSPYHLYNSRGDWYLIALDDLRGDIRSFAVGRIEDWRILDEHFKPDPSFSISKYMESAFVNERGGEMVDIAVRFDAYQARYIRERIWHKTQEVEELPDGGLILRFQSGGLGEIKRWIMQYGEHAEILEPSSLREEVQGEIEKMMKKYKAD